MILSHKHRFIYIKTFKTASTSIETVLSQVCGPDDIITPANGALMARAGNRIAQNWRLDHPDVPRPSVWSRLLRRPERHFHPTVGYYEHMPAWRIRKYIGDEIWASYFKFTFERNPWDRQVSWYYYKTRNKRPRPSFSAFSQVKRKALVHNFDLYSIDENVAVDYVGKYENIAMGMSYVIDRIGLTQLGSLPELNVSTGRERDYRVYYDDRLRNLIAEWYRREIEAFHYEF